MSSPSSRNNEMRRMTAPVGSLTLPSGPPRPSGRPPSPLRNGFTPNSSTGIDPDMDDDDDDDDEHWPERSPSPSSSVSQFAAQFAQKVGSFVGGISQSPKPSASYLPSDAELEAEAERERDSSRREAERILHSEANQRQQVENRVMAMLDNTRPLPPPPSRANTMPNPPSPSNSQKEGPAWWTAAKNKLTPTKEILTPAQQVIQDAKSKDKQGKRLSKAKSKEEWPAGADNPAYQNLNVPKTPPRRPVPNSNSPSPIHPISNMQINMTPSPKVSTGNSPARNDVPPLYAQFDSDGALDVPSTLLTIARRFEKLEKWSVGHVRALEDRMNDVERWLVDKEEEKGSEKDEDSLRHAEHSNAIPKSDTDIRELREDIEELQGRLGELGREVANLATKNLSSAPTKQSAIVEEGIRATSSFAVHSRVASVDPGLPKTPSYKFVPSTSRESTSPPLASAHTKTPTGSRLPYPTGDYTSPTESSLPRAVSPPASPSPMGTSGGTKPLSISGMPMSTSSSNVGIGLNFSQAPLSASSTNYSLHSYSPASSITDINSELPIPKIPAASYERQGSSSPTPRKRYTVALGAPIVDPASHSPSAGKNSVYGHGLSHSPVMGDDSDLGDEDDDYGGETIGKSAAAKLKNGPPTNSERTRPRPQSTYGFSTPTSPLKPRTRSHSTDRFASSDSLNSLSSASGNKFVDPLVQRRRETSDKQKTSIPKLEKGQKIPVGQLVAFFDDRT